MKTLRRFCFALLMLQRCFDPVFANENILSLSFAQASDLAIVNSADLRHGYASQAISEKTWKWGMRAYFPQLTITASENDRFQKIGADSFTKNYGIGLDQLVFDGGRTNMSRNLERKELDLSSYKLDRMALETGEAAISIYRSILSSRLILEIRCEALEVLEEQRRILSEEVELGLALPIDLAGADINLADAKIEIYSQKLDLAELEKQFAEILGLETLPELSEKIDINRSIFLPSLELTAELAIEQNPDLVEARYSIFKRQIEYQYAKRSWVPTVKLTGNFSLTGQKYPLTSHNWSVGLNVDFSGPWFRNRVSGHAGWEPPYDNTAMLQNSLTPIPDPASANGKKQAKLALDLEQEKYEDFLCKIERIAANALEKYTLADQKRLLTIEACDLGAQRCSVEEVRLELGHITRLDLIETLIEQTQREISVVQAAIALLEAERELEKFLDLRPGELQSIGLLQSVGLPSLESQKLMED